MSRAGEGGIRKGPTYYRIELPGRANVREPMPSPEMTLLSGAGRVMKVSLNESQLLAIIADATETLNRMRQCRDAASDNRPMVATDADVIYQTAHAESDDGAVLRRADGSTLVPNSTVDVDSTD